MKKIKTFFATIVVLLCCTTVRAHDFEVNGIYYNITSTEDLTVKVTYKDNNYLTSNAYSGSVIIPSSVTYENCTYTVTSIGSNAFDSCSGLTNVTIPGTVKELEYQSFCRCGNLTEVVFLGSSVEIVGKEAFALTNLADIVLPNSVKEIGAAAFHGCERIVEVSIPESVTSIGDNAFFRCTALSNVTIPGSVTYIGVSAFDDTNLPVENYIRYAGTWAVGITDKNRVRYSFRENTTDLASGVFEYCPNLTKITLPDGIKYIGEYSFYECPALESLTIPKGVTSIGFRAFLGCTSLTEIKIPVGVTKIGGEAFRGCSNLVSVELPIGLAEIGESAFWGCGLTSITLPEGITEIKERTFLHNKFSEIVLPEGITDIRNQAFGQCFNLEKVTLPESLKNVEVAFNDCPISSIVIPEGVQRVVFNAFSISESVTLNSPTIYGQGNFLKRFGENVKEYVIGTNITEIEDYKFANYTNVQSIILPETLTTIGEGAFEECVSLNSINIPANVSEIKDYAFSGCTAMKYITCETLVPSTCGTYTFDNLDTENCILEVPVSVVNVYATTSPWSDFKIKACLIDGEDYENVVDTEIGVATYTRTLNNTKWNALYLPFEIPVTAEFLEDYEVAYINAMHSYDDDEDGEIERLSMEIVKIKNGTLHANHPYLIKAKTEEAKQMNITVENAKLYKAESVTLDCSSVYTKFEITGIYEKMTSAQLAGCYALSDGLWKNLTSGSTLNPFRLYLRVSSREGSPVKMSEAAMARIGIHVQGEETATSVEERLMQKQHKSDAIYDLSGRCVTNPKKGQIYIVNDKKRVY